MRLVSTKIKGILKILLPLVIMDHIIIGHSYRFYLYPYPDYSDITLLPLFR